MFLGVDLGTSSVKAVVMAAEGRVLAEASAPLTVSRPHALWSEQDPQSWVAAAEQAVASLPVDLRGQVRSLGLAGQMHGATLLGADDLPLCPAILWNDGRAQAECAELEKRAPELHEITGNAAMPGFTAPKLLWVRAHEPDLFTQIRKVLLPKDYLRFVWTGEYATDCSDASGALWLDVGKRRWDESLLAATGLSLEHMPRVLEGPEVSGELRPDVAGRLGLPIVPVAAGAGDQAAGALGSGVIAPGDASLALGTSGVLFQVTEGFRPNAREAAHAFCHALPGRWHQMAVILSAASAVDWAVNTLGFASVGEALASAEAAGCSGGALFLPYLTGERTPHNDPQAKGAFFGLTAASGRGELMHAVLEGVAFAFADGQAALVRAGGTSGPVTVMGGGARSAYWGRILAAALDRPLVYRDGAETGPAQGAALLARLALTGEDPALVCRPAPVAATLAPEPERTALYQEQVPRWRTLYQQTKSLFQNGH